jgi:hypothetical protein
VKDRRDTLLQELQKLIEGVLHDGHSRWRTQSRHSTQTGRIRINERQFSDVFAYALTQMTLSQLRVVQSASRSEAIAGLDHSTLAYFPFVGSIWP